MDQEANPKIERPRRATTEEIMDGLKQVAVFNHNHERARADESCPRGYTPANPFRPVSRKRPISRDRETDAEAHKKRGSPRSK